MESQGIKLTRAEIQFIQAHLSDNVQQLVLNFSSSSTVDIKKIAVQLTARQKARNKLPTWYNHPALCFPPALSVEQASSETTARYKASLVAGHKLIDLTGGMGVDTWAFAEQVEQVIYVERNEQLAAITAHNLPLLNRTNVTCLSGDGLTFLQSLADGAADWLFLDPARRDERGGKVVRLEDCEPDVVQLWPLFQQKARHIMLKASPLIDIEATLRQLPGLRAVHVVAVQNEVKEVLFIARQQPDSTEQVMISAVNLTPTETILFTFSRHDERAASVRFSAPDAYIYEPNAALLKAGAFRTLADRLGLSKLAPNSHLYTSPGLVDFPFGRTFRLLAVCKPDRKSLLAALAGKPLRANLSVRNFPQSVEELKKKLGIHDGGDIYILATSLQNGDKRLLVTQKPENT